MGFFERLFGSLRTPPTAIADSPVLQATVRIPEAGEPEVSFAPTEPSSDDLALIALCYAAKIGWLIELEPHVRDIFFLLADETAGLPNEDMSEPDLFKVLLSADSIVQGLEGTPAAVPGGEAFSISLYRSNLTSERGSQLPLSWVTNDTPQPGLAANLPWSAFLLIRSVWRQLTPAGRRRLAQTLEHLTLVLNHDGTVKPGDQQYLRALFLQTTAAWIASGQ